MNTKSILILIAGIFLFAACGNKTPQNQAQEPNDAISIQETVCEGNFSQDAFDAILQQLQLSCKDCYIEFVSEQVMPDNKNLSIWVIPKVSFIETDESFSLDGYVLLVDNQTNKIINKYYEPNAWFSDAYALTNITIDTVMYKLSNNVLAFGIRDNHRAGSSVSPAGQESLDLFIPQGNSLKKIFSHLMYKYCEEYILNIDGTLIISDQKTNGYNNIILKMKVGVDYQEEEVRVARQDSIVTFRYTGTEYKEAKADNSIIHIYHENEDETGYEYDEYFYMGKTLPQVYDIIKEEYKELKSVLPTENMEYSIEAENGTITIIYTYADSKNLSINFFIPDDSKTIEIFKKKQFTRLIHYYAD
jgi:hypothetical protein